MTRSHEKGENEISREARQEAARTGHDVGDILRAMLRKAKKAHDTERSMKIIQAQKFVRDRNRRKRRGRK